MRSALRVVEGPYLRDILDQPRALDATFRGLDEPEALAAVARRLHGGELKRVVLTGMGSSHHGLVPLHLRLVEAGLAPVTVESSELLHYQQALLAEGTLLVLLSQSGRSAEILRLVETVRGRGVVTLALTNTADSPLAREATATVLTHAGEEATVSCKTYLAAQMALAWLGEVLASGDVAAARGALQAAIPGVAEYLAAWRSHVEWLAERLQGVRAVYYAGRGPSLAAACSAGLVTKESTHRPSEGMSSAAFRHGPMDMLDAYCLPPRLRGRLADARPQRGARRRRARGRRAGLPRLRRRSGGGPAPARGPRPRAAGRRAPARRDDHPRDRRPRRPRGRPLRAGHEGDDDGVTLYSGNSASYVSVLNGWKPRAR